MKKIKVAVLIDAWFPFTGGGQIHTKSIIEELKDDCRFSVFHSSSADLMSRIFWSIFVIPKVIASHLSEPYDLIHAHAYLAGITGKVLSTFLGIPVVFTVHGSNMLDLKKLVIQTGKPLFKVDRIKYLFEKMILTRIRYDQIISVSDKFKEHENINKNIMVIANGVDVHEFDEVDATKKKEFTVLFVGRNDPVKGIVYLNEAIEIIKQEQKKSIKLLKITEANLSRRKLIKIYKSCHLFVLPSLSEGQPLTLLEAWAAKLPVVVTKVGDNPRMVKNGVNGYLVPPADTEALADVVIKARQNPDLAKLGLAGYNLVKKQYTWGKAADKTLSIYKEVIHGTG